ncbi:MAG: helix-turn-helix domain-containing protein [Oscillospiraceae bacterium]
MLSIIRKLRTDLNMTQKQPADKLGISDKAVSKWESGVSHS